jgi:hypothetical protein
VPNKVIGSQKKVVVMGKIIVNNKLEPIRHFNLDLSKNMKSISAQIWKKYRVNLNTPLKLISTHCGSNKSKELLNFELANDNYFVFGLRNALYILLNLIAF